MAESQKHRIKKRCDCICGESIIVIFDASNSIEQTNQLNLFCPEWISIMIPQKIEIKIKSIFNS